MINTKLYHCTDFDSLRGILESGAFWPSYCYEKADYLKEPENFAFAMVCFADLMKNEVKPHLHKFNKDCYIQMSKSWGRRKALSNVIYYGKPSIVSSTFNLLLDEIIKRHEGNIEEMSNEIRFTSMLMAFFKQYEGYYWNDKENCWSNDKTVFYTEREWRYVPLVQNKEAFYLSPDEFLDKKFRKEKRDELITRGYTLKFEWNDIEKIGVHSFKQWSIICRYFVNVKKYNPIEVFKKVKMIL